MTEFRGTCVPVGMKGNTNMKFYFQDMNGNRKELTMEEVRRHMSNFQITEAVEAKQADPQEEVSYMTVGGFIVVE